MKKPIFTEEQRRSWYAPELEVAKLKFKREFENGWKEWWSNRNKLNLNSNDR